MKHIIVPLLLFSMAIYQSSAQADDRDWAQFGRYREANRNVNVKPLAVFMGDSITDGWDDTDPDFFRDNNLVCWGISGQTTAEMLVRFRRDVIDLSPKYVVILAGINDIARNNGYISLEDIAGNIISMCELAKVHKIRPVICSITPAAEFIWRMEIGDVADKVMKVNSMLKEYAGDNRIIYVDYHSEIKDGRDGLPEKYSRDGVHPNRQCYGIMENIVLPVLK